MKRNWLITFVIAVILFVLLDLFVADHGHSVLPWSRIAAFYSLFGLLGCLLLIGFAKLIGHFWLQRKEDYYDKDVDTE